MTTNENLIDTIIGENMIVIKINEYEFDLYASYGYKSKYCMILDICLSDSVLYKLYFVNNDGSYKIEYTYKPKTVVGRLQQFKFGQHMSYFKNLLIENGILEYRGDDVYLTNTVLLKLL
jgi:hypothetical protein